MRVLNLVHADQCHVTPALGRLRLLGGPDDAMGQSFKSALGQGVGELEWLRGLPSDEYCRRAHKPPFFSVIKLRAVDSVVDQPSAAASELRAASPPPADAQGVEEHDTEGPSSSMRCAAAAPAKSPRRRLVD